MPRYAVSNSFLFILLFVFSVISNASSYSLKTNFTPLEQGISKVSGITWNPNTKHYITIHSGQKYLAEYDENFNFLRKIYNGANGTKLEDIVYLGTNSAGEDEYAIVVEYGRLYIGTLPQDSNGFKIKNWQTIIFADWGGSYGAEGIAYNQNTETFYVCKENFPRKILQFQRPKTNITNSDELGAFEPFDAHNLFSGVIGSISSCRFDSTTNQLALLGKRDDKIVFVDLSGQLIRSETLTSSAERTGFTINDHGELTVVNRPSSYQVYTSESDPNQPDIEAPSAPTNISANVTEQSVNFTWASSQDNIAVSHYNLYRDNALVAQIVHSDNQTTHNFSDTSVVVETQYQYKMSAVDTSNNESTLTPEAGISVFIEAAVDNQAPTPPTALTAQLETNGVRLNWLPAQDNIAVTQYQIYRDGLLFAEIDYSLNASYLDTDVVAGQTYQYQVSASDQAQNVSTIAPSIAISVTIPTTNIDTEPPTAPSQFIATYNPPSVTLSWQASSDNVAVTGYRILRNNIVLATTQATNYVDSSVQPNTNYQYQIEAFDAQDNSQTSAIRSVSTQVTGGPSTDSPYPISHYVKQGEVLSIHPTPATNLSGITFNQDKLEYIALYNGSSQINVFDQNLNHLRTSSNGRNGNDHEDLTYLGKTVTGEHEYAVVDEYGRMYLGSVEPASDLNYKNFQEIQYGPALSNKGGEGVAYNRLTDTFYVCIEGLNHSDPARAIPMQVLQFSRPSTTNNVSYLDGTLTVTEAFNAEDKLSQHINDISSCYLNNKSQHLLIMSEQSEKILEVDLQGNVIDQLNIDETINDSRMPSHGSQFEGFTFNEDHTELIIVSEGHYYARYQYSGSTNTETLLSLTIDEPANENRVNENVGTGVPFPQGMLFDENTIGLFSGDTELPLQVTPLSKWEDGSIRWLLIDSQVSLLANQSSVLSLKKVSNTNTTLTNEITLSDSATMLTVNTGPLVVDIPKNYGGIIDKAWVNNTLVIDSPTVNTDRGPYITSNGQTYFGSLLTSNTTPNANDRLIKYINDSVNVDSSFSLNRQSPYHLDVSVEQGGKLHTIVRVSGTHLDNNNNSFSTFIVRLHFYAGKPNIEVEHTLVYTGDHTAPVEAYGLKLPFTGDNSLVDGEPVLTSGQLLQTSHNEFQLNGAVNSGQAKGYISKNNSSGSLSVVLRDMAERFPKGLASTSSGIDIQLYPADVEPWQLTRYIPGANESEFSTYPGNQIATYQGETTRFTDHYYLRGAQGLSVTDNYSLLFSTDESSSQTLNQAANKIDGGPLLMLANPDWYSDSLVMGIGKFSFDTSLQSSEGHYRINKFLQTTADFMRINQRQQFNWFGIENYGDIRGRFFGSKTELYWHERGRYGWSGNSGEPSNQLWTQFLRQPNQQLFIDAEALARHTADQQMVHFASATQDDKQLLDGRNLVTSVGSLHRHGMQAWSGFANSPDYSHVAGIETYYYLTGNQRAKDALYEAALFILRQSSDKTSIKNGLDVLDRALAVFYNDTELSAAITAKLNDYNNYLIQETNGLNIVEARLIDFNNNGLHDRDGDGKTNRQLFRTSFEFFIRAAPGLLYRYERTKDPVIGQLIMDAANILVSGDGDDWDLTLDGHAGSYFYHMNLLSFAAQYAQELGYDPAPYYLLAKRAIENNTHAGNDFNDTAPVSLVSVQAIPDNWQDWSWLWQEDIDPANPGILWLSRILMYQNNALQDYHSYRAFIHLATCAAIVPAGDMDLR